MAKLAYLRYAQASSATCLALTLGEHEREEEMTIVNDESQVKKRKLTDVHDDAVYQWLTSYLLHQDQLSWSRTQTIVAVEAGVLAGAFYLNGRAAVIPLLLGAVVIWLCWSLICRDWQIRDQDLSKLDDVHEQFGIRVICDEQHPWWSGKKVSRFLIWVMIAVNIALAAFFLVHGSEDFLKW
jgi:hypothetical protein